MIFPRKVYFGEGEIKQVEKIVDGKVCIVTGRGSTKKLCEEKLLPHLEGKDFIIIPKALSDPPFECVLDVAKEIRKFNPEYVIGFGGGSAIDCAKAALIFAEHPRLKFEEVLKMEDVEITKTFIGVETTSGTASAVTATAVITKDGEKTPIVKPSLQPEVAIYDPELVYELPKTLVAYTGLDTLTHAIEAYVSTISNELTDALALESIALVSRYLLKSYSSDDKKAKGKMHFANMLAGLAFVNARLGIVHAIAHKLGARFKIHHGCANAIVLPYAIEFNSLATEKYDDIAEVFGFTSVEELVNYLKYLNNVMKVPTLKELVKDFRKYVGEIAKKVSQDPLVLTNPRKPDIYEIEELLLKIYNG